MCERHHAWMECMLYVNSTGALSRRCWMLLVLQIADKKQFVKETSNNIYLSYNNSCWLAGTDFSVDPFWIHRYLNCEWNENVFIPSSHDFICFDILKQTFFGDFFLLKINMRRICRWCTLCLFSSISEFRVRKKCLKGVHTYNIDIFKI